MRERALQETKPVGRGMKVWKREGNSGSTGNKYYVAAARIVVIRSRDPPLFRVFHPTAGRL